MAVANTVNFLSSVGPVPRSGLRVLIYDSDPAWSVRLENLFALDRLFVQVGSPSTARHCRALIAEYVPEILVCREDEASQSLFDGEDNPLLLCPESTSVPLLRDAETRTAFSLEPQHHAATLTAIKARVLNRKAAEILRLMDAVRCDAPDDVLHPDDIFWVDSDRNYLIFHAKDGAVRRRGTLASFLSSNPNEFIRVSRSRAVHRAQVKHCLQNANHIVLTLNGGTVLNVSRSCQWEVRRVFPESHC